MSETMEVSSLSKVMVAEMLCSNALDICNSNICRWFSSARPEVLMTEKQHLGHQFLHEASQKESPGCFYMPHLLLGAGIGRSTHTIPTPEGEPGLERAIQICEKPQPRKSYKTTHMCHTKVQSEGLDLLFGIGRFPSGGNASVDLRMHRVARKQLESIPVHGLWKGRDAAQGSPSWGLFG